MILCFCLYRWKYGANTGSNDTRIEVLSQVEKKVTAKLIEVQTKFLEVGKPEN